MQKTVRINLIARNSAAKHAQKLERRQTKTEWKEWHAPTKVVAALKNSYLKEERQHRREDWFLGPLAPNRNSGAKKGAFGTVRQELVSGPLIPKSVRAGPKKVGYAALSEEEQLGKEGFKGDTIVGNVVNGDRVVIVHGPEHLRGLIGTVIHTDIEREEVKLRGINTADVEIPAFSQPEPTKAEPNPPKFTAVELPIPMSHVRLVMAIVDDNGVESDVIIRHVHAGPPYIQQSLGSHLPSHTRYMTGSPGEKALVLPWPEEQIEDDFIHTEGDTTRVAVQSATWTPSMVSSPLGYTSRPDEIISKDKDAYSRASELFLVDTKGMDGMSNVERAGLQGFISDSKLMDRQNRIAEGIMNEFRSKYKTLNTRHDDAEWVKRKMIEDARSIWYQERQVASPSAQAAMANAQRLAREREDRMVGEKKRQAEELVEFMSNAKISGQKFKPDHKLKKKLSRMVEAGTLKTIKEELVELGQINKLGELDASVKAEVQ